MTDEQIDRLADQIAERLAAARPEPLLDAEGAARLLNVPASWVLAEVRAQRIPHRRLGKYVRFSAVELRSWLQEQGSCS